MRDLRKYARQTNIRLLIGGILILFMVGGSLIYAIYGTYGALLGLVCLAAGLSPLLLIWAALAGMDWIVRKARED